MKIRLAHLAGLAAVALSGAAARADDAADFYRGRTPATYFNHVFRKSVGVNPVRRNADEK
jgi:hypothetical protein